MWRRDQKELFYLTVEGQMMAVDVKAGGLGLQFGIPHVLFAAGRLRSAFCDVAADGQRFLCAIRVDTEARDNQFTVLLNWRAGVKK